MRLKIAINRKQAWRWQADLAAGLQADGHHVTVVDGPVGPPLPAAVDTLLAIERTVYRSRDPRPSDRLRDSELAGVLTGSGDGAADLVIDLSGTIEPAGTGVPVLQPRYDGRADPLAGIVSLLEGRIPILAITSAAGLHASGLPAVENRVVLSVAIDHVACRLVDLLRSAVAAWPAIVEPHLPQDGVAPGQPSFAAVRFALAGIGRRASGRVARLLNGGDTWRVGWRLVEGDGVRETGRWPDTTYQWLPDDGRRYFADPFVHVADGRTYVFCEEYPFATGKGVICVFEIDVRGMAAPSRVVLERPYHLSYPFVFDHEGSTWMIPETAASRRIELYRASRFPDQWELEAILHEGEHVSDATVIVFGGRQWMFATETAAHGSTWDALSLFHADRLMGPWTPHRANPVLVDAGSARPGGAMAVVDGRIQRIAQDCRSGYGAGLAFAVVEEIDAQRYSQRVVGRLGPAPAWRMKGVHTLNRAGTVEVIDAFGPR